jgi:hypothetical protein
MGAGGGGDVAVSSGMERGKARVYLFPHLRSERAHLSRLTLPLEATGQGGVQIDDRYPAPLVPLHGSSGEKKTTEVASSTLDPMTPCISCQILLIRSTRCFA